MYLPVLDPNTWSFTPELLPQNTYLVGGAVRDALLGREKPKQDLDFVLEKDVIATAKAIANRYKAGFVLLDAEREIARVVFANATADFARQEGESLEIDLQRRDFTVNAIAYNFLTQELIDPLGGYPDLQAKILRMVKPSNLQDDPLRLLRCYRQAAQLGMMIEAETLAVIREFAPLIATVAAERVQAELNYLLEPCSNIVWLKAAITDGLLSPWLSISPSLDLVDSAFHLLKETWWKIGQELVNYLKGSANLSLIAVAKLAILLPSNPELAAIKLSELKLSKVEIKAVSNIINCWLEFGDKLSKLSIAEQFFLFRQAGVNFPAIALLALTKGVAIKDIAPLVNRYLNPTDPVAHLVPLVTGNELMQALNLPSGRLVGELLLKLQIAQAEGKITTSEAALELAGKMMN
ncbi:[cytidine(C)-cytidine(C)-adenosine (A)]-adding enzyme [Merismopedia glauca CCAP 1448/3]|uniref:[cytidine(C)-cytidine(C)-adenosine (A)]-adding enzyme n=2 Tax=Merismopedia TaxID=53402 RepID=A0A2T1C4X7_9CYAN|nr:[cytidine(C)-cytidine(C)-adenosine (A)]-adding enzyme [Merismopedia glauca CCAP 1448/3]